MNGIDYSKVTDNPKVVELLKQRDEIEKQIDEIDEMAMRNFFKIKMESLVLGGDYDWKNNF